MTILNGKFFAKINQIADRIIYLGYMNLIWILFSLLGLGVLGVFPATAAMFAVYRQEKIHKRAINFKLYWSYYKENFWQANIIGWILMVIGYILYLDFHLITFMEGTFADIVYSAIFAITIIYLLVLCYIFPVFTHFKLSMGKYFLSALTMVVTKPVQTILIGVVSIFHVYVMLRIHFLIPLFGISVWVYFVTQLSQSAFNKNNKAI